MRTALIVGQVVIAVLLSLSILVQQRGSGLGSAFGGNGTGFYVAKRGAEKVLSIATVILVVLFVANSLAFLFV